MIKLAVELTARYLASRKENGTINTSLQRRQTQPRNDAHGQKDPAGRSGD